MALRDLLVYVDQTEWRCVDGSASVVMPRQARCADLCIVPSEQRCSR